MTDPQDTGRLTFRTLWGGPSPQAGLIEALAQIKHRLRQASFSYDFDLFLTIGGDITPGVGSSGLHTPRVFLKRRRVTGEIRMTREDISSAAEPAALLRQTIHEAVSELIGLVAVRDATLEADAERAKIAFLLEKDPA